MGQVTRADPEKREERHYVGRALMLASRTGDERINKLSFADESMTMGPFGEHSLLR
jgi:hypothetical protein